MNKEEIQKKYEEAKVLQVDIKENLQLLTGLAGRIKVSIAALETTLAEVDKPELRHGDYGYEPTMGERIYMKGLGGPNRYAYGRGMWNKNLKAENIAGRLDQKGAIILGNIFDDLKELAKPLKVFHLLDPQNDRTIFFKAHSDNLYVAINNPDGIKVIDINIPLRQAVKVLRRLLHTQEQNAKP